MSCRPSVGLACHALFLLVATSCTTKEAAPRSADTGSPPKTPPQHAPFGEPEEDAPWPSAAEEDEHAELAQAARAIDRALCPDSCCVTGLQEAGRDHQGQDLFVAALHGDRDCIAPSPSPPGPFGSGSLDRVRAPGRRAKARAEAERSQAAEEPSDDLMGEPHACTPADFHLVARKGGRVRDVALLTRSCNRPPDFPDPGDTVEVDKENKIVTNSGGSGHSLWESFSVSIGLDPLRIVKVETSSFYRSSPNDENSRSWDWDNFTGTSQWYAVDCEKSARQETERSQRTARPTTDEDEGVPTFGIAGVLIPEVALPADFVTDGWRTTSLGDCSASLDYSIHGEAGKSPANAHVVISGTTLFVEVSDDRFVGSGKSWVKEDHLELWMGSPAAEDRRCSAEDGKGTIVQWGIRVTDGEVFPAHGSPKPLVGVEHVLLKRKARFKIPLPQGVGEGITVVYSDSDDGQRQKHLIATSQFRFGDPATLGAVYNVEAKDATCIVKKGTLQPKRVPLEPSTDKPMMDGRL